MVNATPQAVIKIIRKGGTRTPSQIRNQWRYISKGNEVPLELPDDMQGAVLQSAEWSPASRDWAVGTGRFTIGQRQAATNDMTTHIVVSFPPGTDPQRAKDASRAWAEMMFRETAHNHDDDDDDMAGDEAMAGSPYERPQKYNYISAFHTDREHPHMHIVVNRRGDEGGWLKISKRHPVMNYDNMREKLVEAAAGHGIELEATSRTERGIEGRPINDAQYRRMERERLIEINPANNTNRPLNSASESDGDFGYDEDSDIEYQMAEDAPAHDDMAIPDDIVVDDEEFADDDISLVSVARAGDGQNDGYDGDSEDDRGTSRKRDRTEGQDASSGDESSDDGGGKPAALTGEALEALQASRRQTEDKQGGSGSDTDSEADYSPKRKRGRVSEPEDAATALPEGASPARQTGASDGGPAAAPDRADAPGRAATPAPDTANAAQDEHPDSDGGNSAAEDATGPARRTRRGDVPERTMVLRSDTEKQRQEDEAAAMHLRSGRIIPKRGREEEDRPDERNTRPRHR